MPLAQRISIPVKRRIEVECDNHNACTFGRKAIFIDRHILNQYDASREKSTRLSSPLVWIGGDKAMRPAVVERHVK
jgi:hypothetical protein